DGCLVRRRVARRQGGEHGLADGVGAPRAHGRGRGGEPGRAARHRLPRPHAGRGGHVVRAPLHRHGLPAPLLPPLPPLPALLPAHGARTVRAAGRRGGEAMSVGIERLSVYVPQYALRLTDLAAARDVPPDKLTAGLGVQEMAIAPPCEDVVTLAARRSSTASTRSSATSTRSRARSWPTAASSGRRSSPARHSPTVSCGSSTTRPSPRWR